MNTASTSPSRSTDDLLQQFVSELQEWDAEVAAGVAAVATLQRCFGELDSSKPPKEAQDVHKRLLELAPSFRLEQYIHQQQKPAAEASDAASSIHKAINSLKAAVGEKQQLLGSILDTCTQCQDAVLSQQLAGTALVPPTAGTVKPDEDSQQDTRTQVVVTAATVTAAAAAAGQQATAASTASDTIDPNAPTIAVEQHLQPEEVALLMGVVTTGLQQDLQWMEAAVGSISLDTTAEELNTVRTLWELQPFTNETAVASIAAAAAASAGSGTTVGR